MDIVRTLVEHAALGIEIVAVMIIVAAAADSFVRFVWHIGRQRPGGIESFKHRLGRGLLLGLEFLIAADIARTVILEATLYNIGVLGLLVLVRTFLCWSLLVEMDGRWPWKAAEGSAAAAAAKDAAEKK